MKINSKISKFQEGGAMPTEAQGQTQGTTQGATGGAEQQDPLAQLAQMAQQALQTQDPQAAFAVCEGLLQLIQQMIQAQQGGSGGQQPPTEEPVYAKKGSKLQKKKM